jgi:hypothetical protein
LACVLIACMVPVPAPFSSLPCVADFSLICPYTFLYATHGFATWTVACIAICIFFI